MSAAMVIALANATAFLKRANFFPRRDASAGSWTNPTVTQESRNARTAMRAIPWFSNSPPMM